MQIAVLYFLSVLLELSIFSNRRLWRAKAYILGIDFFLLAFVSVLTIIHSSNLLTGTFLLLSAYRIFNGLRIIQGRMNQKYLHRSTQTTCLYLVGAQITVALLILLWDKTRPSITNHELFAIFIILQMIAAFFIVYCMVRNIIKSRPQTLTGYTESSHLPTLSVCIPARNETDDLEQCLQTLLDSDYPKLEIIVLDDCSQNKRTPEIIKFFAHDGVRFIAGTEPPESWLSKNWAYQQLLDNADGEIIVFCGVDIRFEKDSLRKLIGELQHEKLDMMSVLPQRFDEVHLSFIQSLRYWWEFALPRFLVKRPMVLSSCWAIKRSSLTRFGGFASVTRNIVPEAIVARTLLITGTYRFIRNANYLGVGSVKKVSDQFDTAIRTRYPQLHKKPEFVALISLTELCIFVVPYILLVSLIWVHIGALLQIAVIISCVALILCYEIMIVVTLPKASVLSIFIFPFAMVIDVVLLNLSMIRYEFSTVEWKTRNVCIPTMHVTDRLPPLS